MRNDIINALVEQGSDLRKEVKELIYKLRELQDNELEVRILIEIARMKRDKATQIKPPEMTDDDLNELDALQLKGLLDTLRTNLVQAKSILQTQEALLKAMQNE